MQPQKVAHAAGTKSEAAVSLELVSRVYGRGPGAVKALDEVTVAFAVGRFTAVMGPSGSGKTTLLQCSAGLDRPTAGRVRIAEIDLGRLSERRLAMLRRRRIGFVFQSFNLVGSLSAEQNVALPLRLDGRRPKRELVIAALERVGLADRARHRPAELSGGQQQRVAIARALVTNPDVLFADEPTGALDIRSGRTVLEALRSVVDSLGQTVVMVTHDPVAAACADHVVLMADGRLVDTVAAPSAEQVAERLTGLGS